jgi:hypothetical protein
MRDAPLRREYSITTAGVQGVCGAECRFRQGFRSQIPSLLPIRDCTHSFERRCWEEDAVVEIDSLVNLIRCLLAEFDPEEGFP